MYLLFQMVNKTDYKIKKTTKKKKKNKKIYMVNYKKIKKKHGLFQNVIYQYKEVISTFYYIIF
jgi:hypothetical protein